MPRVVFVVRVTTRTPSTTHTRIIHLPHLPLPTNVNCLKMSLITPDLGLLFWMLISFGLVFGILAKFGFPIITRSVASRREHIESSLRAADEANSRLAGIEAQAQKLLEDAQARQNEILKQATANGERIVQEAREQAQVEAARELEAAKQQIETEKRKALGEIRSTVALLSVDVAEKVLRQQLGDKESQQSFAMRLVEEAERAEQGREA